METLFQNLCSINTLHQAWKVVRQKNSAGGIDGLTVAEFEDDLGANLRGLQQELEKREWQPEPYLQVEIKKKKNEAERRKLGLLTIKDKIVQQAIKRLVEDRFERLFLNNSYGYRPEKGHTRAIHRTLFEFKTKKNNWVLQLDIDDYFDTIDHNLLFERLKSVIPDEEIIRLIDLCVKMGVVNNKLKWREIKTGVPQGAVLSPLLANFYLHPFDQFVTTKANAYIRYADDFLILCATREEAEKLLAKAEEFLTQRLHLKCNAPIIESVDTGVEFLGVVVKRSGISLSEKKKEDLLERIRTIQLDGVVLSKKSMETLKGIHVYYGQLLAMEYLLEFDRVLRESIRVLLNQNWKNFRGQDAVVECFKVIQFYAEETILKKKEILRELVEQYAELKRRESGTKPDVGLNKRLILRKKREYQKREGQGAELVVNTLGCFIGVNHRGLSVRQKGVVIMEAPVSNLEHLTVMTEAVSISAAAIQYCMENKIPVDFFDRQGKLYASLMSPVFMECTLWEKQARMDKEQREVLAAKIIYGKLKNQLNLIKYFHKYHKGAVGMLAEKYTNVLKVLEELIDQVKCFHSEADDYQEELMAREAAGAVAYWDYVRMLIADDDVVFETREQKGAKYLVNSLLNYGYALLYARVWQALLLAKLNPMESVIHVRQAGRPTLVYDVIEVFRAQAVDRVVISLIQKGEPVTMDGDLLSEKTKVLLVQNILERINRYEKYRGEEMKFTDIIIRQAKEIAAFVADGSIYKPYIAKW